MRSATTACLAPVSEATPLMRISLVPAPSTFAPIAFRQSARSAISGSRAAFFSTVSPLRQHGGEHGVLGGADGDERKVDLGALQAAQRRRFHIALLDDDIGAHRLERLQVQIHRPRADGAAAGQRHRRVPHAREQRAQHVERGAHLPHLVVRRDGRDDLGRVHAQRVRFLDPGDLDAQRASAAAP